MDVPLDCRRHSQGSTIQLGSKVGEGAVPIKVETGGAAAAAPPTSRSSPAAAPSAPAPAAGGALVKLPYPTLVTSRRTGHRPFR